MIKPAPWAVNKAEVTKPWQWAWDGLVGAWLFDGGDGPVVYDKTRVNDGDLTIGSGAWAASKEGHILTLAGDGYVDTGVTELPGGVGLHAASSQQWTLAARFRTTDIGTIVAKRGSTIGSSTFSVYFSSGSRTPRTIIRGLTTDTDWGLNDGALHTVWVTWDGSAAVAYYDDAQGALSLNVGTANDEITQRIIIGARTNGTAFYLTGSFSFVHVWDYAVPPAAIREFDRDPFGPFRRGRQLILTSDAVRQTRFTAS